MGESLKKQHRDANTPALLRACYNSVVGIEAFDRCAW